MIVTLADGTSFKLLTPDQLTLITKIRIQKDTGYGPVKLNAALGGMQLVQEQIVSAMPDTEGAAVTASLVVALEKIAAEGDLDLLAMGCLVWGSRMQQGEPTITLEEACNFPDQQATWEMEPDELREFEKRKAEAEAAGPTPTSAPISGRGRKPSGGRPALPAK